MRICYDLYIWYPSRRHAFNHSKTIPVVGITNYDYCSNVYWLLGEVDHKNIDINNVKDRCYMIVETRKGYHFYFKEHDTNPLRLIHKALKKYKWLDKHHLYMGLRRYRRTNDIKNAFLVLRISPKYEKPDLKIIYIDNSLPVFHRQILSLIQSLNS